MLPRVEGMAQETRGSVKRPGWQSVGSVSGDGGLVATVGVKSDDDVTLRLGLRGANGGDAGVGGTFSRDRIRELRRLLGDAIGEEQIGPTVRRVPRRRPRGR
jgi:hypothetical protein